MVRSRPDPTPIAQVLVDALPALIEQAATTGGPLALAVYAMRTALSEAERVIRTANGPSGPPAFGSRPRLRD